LLTLTRISIGPCGDGSIEMRGSGQLQMLLPNRAETFLAHAYRRDAGRRAEWGNRAARIGIREIAGPLGASVPPGYKSGHGDASRIFARSSTWSE
jgi:hypothetical protein